jgi:hypothetical protein
MLPADHAAPARTATAALLPVAFGRDDAGAAVALYRAIAAVHRAERIMRRRA